MISDNRDPKKYFASITDKVNDDLKDVVSIEFPPNLYNPMRYVLASKGKRFRPALLILACESIGGTMEASYNASLAIEILHNFTLVHDDIMDNDDLRRGRTTVHKKWNDNIAILAGDGLIALAYRYLLKTDSPNMRPIIKIFSEAIIKICEGQSLDKDMETIDEVSIDEYLDMIERKTGVLISISAEIGGLLGIGTDQQVAELKKFGLELGIAFQIQDDLLDIISEEEIIGKNVGSDLEQGKKTYPIILFAERASKKDRAFLIETLKNRNAGKNEIKRVQKMLLEYNVAKDTKTEVNNLLDRANAGILESSNNILSTNLLYLSDMIRNRVH
jgi:geranylgeranyl diphosphate synthase type II